MVQERSTSALKKTSNNFKKALHSWKINFQLKWKEKKNK